MQGLDAIFRVLEVRRDGPRHIVKGVATGFLVSDEGYALTPWHAFDYSLARRTFTSTRRLSHVRITPWWSDPNDSIWWESPVVVGKWSNRDQDVAILGLETRVVARFKLAAMPLCLQLRPGLMVEALGFNRAFHLRDANTVRGRLLDRRDLIRPLPNDRVHDQRVIDVLFADIPFEEGMSGAPLMPVDSRVAIGMQTASDLPQRSTSGFPLLARMLNGHEARGYATPISVVEDAWPEIRRYCRIVGLPDSRLDHYTVERAQKTVASGMSFVPFRRGAV